MRAIVQNFYPGWLVHVGLFICAGLVVGTSTYTFGLYVIPVTQELGMSRADFSNGFICLLLGVALMSPVAGRLLDKLSARLLILAGSFMYAIGLTGLTMTDSGLLMMLLILVPISFGYTTCGVLAVNTVVVRWFKRRRGTALGIMAVSTSAGAFVMVPVTAFMIENFSWRTAMMTNGAITLGIVALMVLLFVRNFPKGSERGYADEFADHESDNAQQQTSTATANPWTYKELLCNRNFWLFTLAIGLLLASDQSMVTAQVPYFVDIGIKLESAALIVSCMTASAICGKLLVGYLADKVDLRLVFYAVALIHIALQLVYLAAPGFWTLLCLATVLGVAIGGVYPVWSTMLAWLFGTHNFGTVMGLMTIVVKGISVVAVRFVGEVYDATGTYVPAFVVFMVTVVIAMVLVALLRPETRSDTASAGARGSSDTSATPVASQS